MAKFPMASVLISALVTLFVSAPAAQAADLKDALTAALRSDPQLREAQANLMAAQEAKPQAWSQLRPQITGTGSIGTSEASGSSIFQQQDPFGDVVNLTSNFESEVNQDTQWRLQLRQTVFRWDQWVALDQADTSIAQSDANFRAAEQDLLVRVAQRYFDVLAARDQLDAVRATKDAVARQLEQAETRFEVGLIAITDVREAQAAFDEAVANEIAAKRSLGTARELLREVTGEYFPELESPGSNLPLVSPQPAGVESWVEQAKQQNLNIVAGRLGVELAQHETRSRKTAHYPTLDLVFSRSDSDQDADRDNLSGSGFQIADSNVQSDSISLQLSVPIYTGGSNSSRIRESVHLERAAKERLERVTRETERLTRDSFEGVTSEIARVQALAKSLESSRTALEATEAGFDVGTRTTVDVLNARQDLARARTNYLGSRYDYIINVLNLKFAAGILGAADLEEVNQWLEAAVVVPASQ